MVHLTRHAHELLARQHGVASTQQLLDTGLSARQLRHLQQSQDLELVLRGAYRTPSAPDTELARCAAVCAARSDVAIAGPTAGRLWGFRRLPSDHRIHVLAPPASNPAIARWVVPFRTGARHDHDVVERDDGIRITTRARTAYDLARWLGPDDLLSVIEQAAHDGRLDDGDFLDVAADWLSPRRPWAREFLQALDRRLPGGPAESHPEVRVAEALSRAGVRGLVRQHGIRTPRSRRCPIRPRCTGAPVGDRDRSPSQPPRDVGHRVRCSPRPRRRCHRLDDESCVRCPVPGTVQRNDRRTGCHSRRPPAAPRRDDERTARIPPLHSSQPAPPPHR